VKVGHRQTLTANITPTRGNFGGGFVFGEAGLNFGVLEGKMLFGGGLPTCEDSLVQAQICQFNEDMNSLSAKDPPKEMSALYWCRNLCALSCFCLLLLGCAVPSGGLVDSRGEKLKKATASLLFTPAKTSHWEPWLVPGKRSEPFEAVHVLGRDALRVKADNSVSILRQRFDDGLPAVRRLAFSWKVDVLPVDADLQDSQAEDAPVRLVLTFGGDRSLLSARTHRLSELSRLLTGEELPYATLAYVWSAKDSLGTVVHNPRTDRIRKLVVETGDLSLGRWLHYDRDVQADFVQAFGERPGPLLALALMTDTDNTSSQLQAWYGRLQLEVAKGPVDEKAVTLEKIQVAAPDGPLPR
jgi:hypothetical protein